MGRVSSCRHFRRSERRRSLRRSVRSGLQELAVDLGCAPLENIPRPHIAIQLDLGQHQLIALARIAGNDLPVGLDDKHLALFDINDPHAVFPGPCSQQGFIPLPVTAEGGNQQYLCALQSQVFWGLPESDGRNRSAHRACRRSSSRRESYYPAN